MHVLCRSSFLLHVLIFEAAPARGFSALPIWSELRKAILPTTPLPTTVDCLVEAKRNPAAIIDDIIDAKADPTLPTLYRERNGWCVHSSRLWLALEAKGVRYNTVLVEARSDTYDGSPTQDEQDETDGRPKRLVGTMDLPQLGVVSNGGRYQILSAAGDQECVALLEQLDEIFPRSNPIWCPLNDGGEPLCNSQSTHSWK